MRFNHQCFRRYCRYHCVLFLLFFVPALVVADSATNLVFTVSSPQVGNIAFSPVVQLTAVDAKGKTDNSYHKTKTLKFWSSYNNPSTGTTQVTIGGTPIATNSSGTNFNIEFDNGVATLPAINYADVGQITLNVIDTAKDGPNCGGSCSSPAIVVQPAGFIVSGTGIPGSNDPNSTTAFAKAGQPFAATVTAVVSGGLVANNYGNEKSPSEIVVLSASLNAPAGGNFGIFAPGTVAKSGNGIFAVSGISYGEVGAINVSANAIDTTGANLGKYLGTLLPASVQNPVILGRFQPDHLIVAANIPVFATACKKDGFSYVGQPFAWITAPVLTITAENASNQITQNYTGAWKKISNTNFPFSTQLYSQATTTSSGTPSVSANSLTQPSETLISPGKQSYTFSAGSFSISAPNPGNTPYPSFIPNIVLSIAVQDSDTPAVMGQPSSCILSGAGAASTCSAGGAGIAFNNGASFLHGRLAVFECCGPNQMHMNLPVQVQYYTANNGFTVNNMDNTCTILSGSNYVINTPAPANAVTPSSVSLPGNLTNGQGTITLGAPSTAPTSGQTIFSLLLDVSHQNLPWLQGNWPGTAGYSNPLAMVNWGQSAGNNRVIHIRENY